MGTGNRSAFVFAVWRSMFTVTGGPGVDGAPGVIPRGTSAFLRADDFYENCGKWIAGFHRVR